MSRRAAAPAKRAAPTPHLHQRRDRVVVARREAAQRRGAARDLGDGRQPLVGAGNHLRARGAMGGLSWRPGTYAWLPF